MISEEQVRHVAIQELSLEDVPPTANPLNLTNVSRPDEPRGELTREEALAPAPEPIDGLFAVPRID
ncbi:MAG: aspartyl/glutamyl-tRNA(Asn/Gln) amidotransferase subunit [Rubrobacteraceae bacterium]|nr:aspartyl/glutamyl-tRNA(Asn/Gln) amidotransferase subunit [Rubrobacteraceae bacterium]